MRRWPNVRSLLAAALTAAALFSPAAALAQSAGNQQYVDPLANQHTKTNKNTTPAPSSRPSTSAAPAPAANAPATSAPASSAPASSSQAAVTTASQPTATASTQQNDAPAQSSSRTLPFTGLNLVPALLVAVGLLGAGIALRRIARRT